VRVILGGVSELRGTVELSNGSPAAGARVTLTGQPDPGCAGESCVVFADATGRFAFVNVPARTFSVTAVDAVSTFLKGAVGGTLNPGEVKQGLRIVLTPSFAVSGRVVLPDGTVVPRAVAELTGTGNFQLY